MIVSPKRAVAFFSSFFFLVILGEGESTVNKSFELFSPDLKIKVVVGTDPELTYSVYCDDQKVILPSPIAMTLSGKGEVILGKKSHLLSHKTRSVDEKITPVVQEKRAVVINRFNEIRLNFKGNYGLIFRAYDDGVAYRFLTNFKERVKIKDEEVALRFRPDPQVYFPVVESFFSSFEKNYSYLPMSQITAEKMAFLPVLVEMEKDGLKIAVTEADLDDYPGLYLVGSPDGSSMLRGKFPPFPLREEQKGDRTLVVREGADYIADTVGQREYPWRVLAIARRDAELIDNDIVYRLARPTELDDTSWIRPGKVAWDWWNALNIYGVDFESGINTATYRYCIDFAARYGLDYVILDEGWSDTADLFKINPALDMPTLLAYAREKNVGLILWCVWSTLDRQLEEALNLFREWGVKGIKVDFMNRDDQKVVNFYKRVAEEAAKRRLIVDFHGAFKPTGLRRSYPNVLTREGVLGLEYSKWSDRVTPEHDLLIPFIRMLAGPMDYTPGAMRNAAEKNFKAIFTEPMSQGTRCHQLAMFVVYESPLQMLCDSPSAYLREPEVMEFLARVPTVWEETRTLDARVGDFVVVARRKGKEWYIGAMTDWTPRELEVDFGFLEGGEFAAEIYADGVNAAKYASDYKRTRSVIRAGHRLRIHLAPGGGWVARLVKDSR